jgi:hypothetical protein
MKIKLVFAFLFLLKLTSGATEWCNYYIYVEKDYMQGPWSRADLIYNYSKEKYLHPVLCEDLFGSEKEQLIYAVMGHLKKESVYHYTFKYTVKELGDTAFIQTKDTIPGFKSIKNELIASLLLNNYKVLTIKQATISNSYVLSDLSLPFMDLCLPPKPEGTRAAEPAMRADTSKQKTSLLKETPQPDTLKTKDRTQEDMKNIENPFPSGLWLIVSVVINLTLGLFLILNRKKS